MEETDAWIVLNASELTPSRQNALLEHFGSAGEILGATDEQLSAVDGITSREIKKIRAAERDLDLGEIKEAMLQWGLHLLPRTSDEYPELLAEIDGPPAMLFVQGD
ncbi:MAG: hypothetical protein ACLFWB_08950, partial [Armatimonadota bacterium]